MPNYAPPSHRNIEIARLPIWPVGLNPAVEIGETGLFMGARTVLARMAKTGTHLDLDADKQRLFTLLSIADGRPVSTGAIKSIEAASDYWRHGDKALANFRLIFGGLPRLADPVDAYRLQLAEYLIDEGMAPRALMEELDIDSTGLEVIKYAPDQRRVPPGNGRESGRWAFADDFDEEPPPRSRNIRLAANEKMPGGVTYDEKIQGQMGPRGFTAKQIDEAVKYGTRIDAINKSNGAPAVRYVNPTTGQSVVIDTETNSVLQVARPDFKFGPQGGDAPGAVMRPAPSAPPVLDDPLIGPEIFISE